MDVSVGNKRKTRKRASDELSKVMMNEANDEYDLNEPTMGEKLADMSLVADAKLVESKQEDHPAEVKPPSADSVHLLLKQALRAEDHALLLNCLYTKDDQVWQHFLNLIQLGKGDNDDIGRSFPSGDKKFSFLIESIRCAEAFGLTNFHDPVKVTLFAITCN